MEKGIPISSILKIIPGIIIKLDNKGNYLEILTNEPEKLILPEEEIIGKNISDVFPPETAERVFAVIKKAVLSKSVQAVNYEAETPSGKRSFEAYISSEEDQTLTVFVQDVTEKKRIEKKASKSDKIFREYSQLISLFDSIEHFIYVSDIDTHEILYVNRAFQNNFRESPVGKVCYREFQGLDSPCGFCNNDRIRSNGYEPIYWEHFNPKLNKHFHLTDRLIRWPDGRDVRFEMAVDITEHKVLESRLHFLSVTDELTGCWNRRYFMRQGDREFERASRYRHGFSLILYDIDLFKKINDSFGHFAGDKVLKRIIEIVRHDLRETDILGRIGGDEFGIILPHSDISSSFTMAERLRKNVRCEFLKHGGQEIRFSVSIGTTMFHSGVKSFSEMMRVADDALFRAKRNGRNCTVESI